MSGLIIKAILLVAVTHGIRWLGRRLGPRRGGLILGLPSSTALVLIACGHERGVGDSAEMAEACLLGLVGAVVLPLAYARMLSLGRRLPITTAAAISAYVTVAWIFSLLPPPGALGCLAIASTAVSAACHFSGRIPAAKEGKRTIAPSRLRCLALRTLVPVAYLITIETLRNTCGPRWAGLLSPFPGMTLAVLIVTHLEAGATEATRMARALPPGSWAMIAFLAAFRLTGPIFGLAWATANGYLLAAAALWTLGWMRPTALAPVRAFARRSMTHLKTWHRPVMPVASPHTRPREIYVRRHRAGRSLALAPLVEPIGF